MSPDPVTLPDRVATELLHGEVAHLLGTAGIPVLHVKGPTVIRWLHPDGRRQWGDVDVLLPPDRVDDAREVLAACGFGELFPGVDHRSSEDHSVVLARAAGSAGGGEVDLHHRFPGIGLAPGPAFALLWRRRVPDRLAHTPVWFPDHPTRALLLVLNTARSADLAQARDDLRRLLRADVNWDAVAALGAELDALGALRAGLELEPGGARVRDSHAALRDFPRSPEWQLRTAGAPRTAVRWAQLRAVPRRRRPAVLARWLVPDPAVLRMRDPRAAAGRAALVRAYARRLLDGVRSVPPAVRAVRQAGGGGR